ncbi:MAG: hypothetical protein DDT24_00554 [Chloroflexi bacterium]|nr:hypothetical protein [Chloroflexota bacterium]
MPSSLQHLLYCRVDGAFSPFEYACLREHTWSATYCGDILVLMVHFSHQPEHPFVLFKVQKTRVAAGKDDDVKVIGAYLIYQGIGYYLDPMCPVNSALL